MPALTYDNALAAMRKAYESGDITSAQRMAMLAKKLKSTVPVDEAQDEVSTFMEPVRSQAPNDLPPPVPTQEELDKYHAEHPKKRPHVQQDVQETAIALIQNAGAAAISGMEAAGRVLMSPFTDESVGDIKTNLQNNINQLGYAPESETSTKMLEGISNVMEPIDTATFRAGSVLEDIPGVGPAAATTLKVGLDAAIGALTGRLVGKGVAVGKAKIQARAQIKAERAATAARKKAADQLFAVKEQEKASKLGTPTSTPADRSGVVRAKKEFIKEYLVAHKGTKTPKAEVLRQAERQWIESTKQAMIEEDILWRAQQARLEQEAMKNPVPRDLKKTKPIELPPPRKATAITARAKDAADSVGNFLGTVVARLDAIDPTKLLSTKIRHMEWNIESKMVFRNQIMDDFYSISKKMYNSKLAGNWHRAYLEQDWNKMQALAIEAGAQPTRWGKASPTVLETFKNVKDTLNTMGIEAMESGFRGFALIKNYMPRHMNQGTLRALEKDPQLAELLGEKRMQRITKIMKKTYDDEITRMEALNAAITGGGSAKIPAVVASSAKKRGKLLGDSLYDPAHVAVQRYINDMTESVEIRKFLGKNKASLDDSLASFMDDQGMMLNLGPREHDVLRNVLEARFKEGRMHTNHFLQAVKNYGYITSIGNVWSALTQFGDIFASMRVLGLKNTMTGLGDMLAGKGIKTAEIGYEQIMKEMADPSRSAIWLDRTLTYSGFKTMDKLGKTVVVNSSRRRHIGLTKTAKGREQLGKMYGPIFKNAPEEYQTFLNDLAKGDIKNPNVKFAIFNDLADLQPITMSDMPLSYLRNPNGRMLWALKTWSAQQLNTFYRHSVQEFKRGNRTEAAKNTLKFTLYNVMLGTAGIDTAKEWLAKALAGEELTPEDVKDNTAEAFLRTMFISRYSIEKSRGVTDIWHIISDIAAPSLVGTMVRAERALKQEEMSDKMKELFKMMPLLGPAYGAVEKAKEGK